MIICSKKFDSALNKPYFCLIFLIKSMNYLSFLQLVSIYRKYISDDDVRHSIKYKSVAAFDMNCTERSSNPLVTNVPKFMLSSEYGREPVQKHFN